MQQNNNKQNSRNIIDVFLKKKSHIEILPRCAGKYSI